MIFYKWPKQYQIMFGIEYSSGGITVYTSKEDKVNLQ